MAFEFTPAQRRAIEDRGAAVLVSAAAGSGKTRVLTERLIRYVTDPDRPVDVDRFLVITYTRAAAAELKSRILEALAALAAAHPEDRRLRRQQSLCCRAHIGTIHSFCTELIREHCHRLGIPPAFTVAEEERAERIRAGVLTRVLERHYENIEHEPEFRLLADTVGAGRDDRRLEETLLRVYGKLRSMPDPKAWAQAQKTALAAPEGTDAGATVWGKELLTAYLKPQAAYQAAELEGAIAELTAAGGSFETAYLPSFTATAEALRELARALDLGWDKAREYRKIPFPKLKPLKKDADPAVKGRVTAVRDACKKAAVRFAETLDSDSGTLLRQQRETVPAMSALLDLALELDAAFSAEKLRRGCLDFADLEHYALRLLTEGDEGKPSHAAAETAFRFREIMVDEYQDVSPIQDRIFRALSLEGRNLFLVGDVKQSIYRFRLAEPRLFLEKYERYADAESAKEGEPRRILLQENFRSRAAVLDAANLVFSAVMSKELGELDYDAAAALKFAAPGYPPGTDTPVELDILDAGAASAAGADDELPPEKNELEARFVAGRILEMMSSGTQVYGPEGPRRCGWGDFVILLRSPGSRGAVFRRVLAERGIPVDAAAAGGFFTSLEITVAVNLLALTDNPHADVPLISVLRSPVFSFTADELTAIRSRDREGSFYQALRRAAEEGDARCAAFLEKLEGWRALAPDLRPDELLWRVCADTELFAVCAAMRDGETRRGRLLQLFEYARSFDDSGYRGLFRFVNWLRRLAEKGMEPEPAAGGDAVRILSIHKSKGLEFPFVFLCDLDHRFNRGDTGETVLLHSELGLGPKYVDREQGVEYPTLARRAIEHRLTTELLSEELRVLYVAMTRARERLILTCTWKEAAGTLEKLRDTAAKPGPIPPAVLRGVSAPGRWVALAALRAPERLPVRIIGELPPAGTSPEESPADGAVQDALEGELRRRLDFAYPWPGAAALPSRLTATELKGSRETPDPESEPLTPVEQPPEFRRVDFTGPRRLSAAERGTATHLFLQHLDLKKTDSPDRLREELDRVAALGLLTPEERDAVDLNAVLKLFRSPLGASMLAATELRREFRFTLLAAASAYYEGAHPEDRLLLQGVVDCFFIEDGAVTLVDYKTDRVSAEEAKARAERYRGQLDAYAGALTRILGLPVRRRVLWFLTPGAAVEL